MMQQKQWKKNANTYGVITVMPQWGCCDMDNLLPAVVSFWLVLVHYDIFTVLLYSYFSLAHCMDHTHQVSCYVQM